MAFGFFTQRPSIPSLQSASDLQPQEDDALLGGIVRLVQLVVVTTLDAPHVPFGDGPLPPPPPWFASAPPWHAATTTRRAVTDAMRMGRV